MSQMVMLEALLTALIMLGAIFYVSDYQSPGSSIPAIEKLATQRDYDFLHTADSILLKNDPCKGHTELERLLIDGVNANDTEWRSRTHRLIGDDTEANLYVSSGGRGYYPLFEKRDFVGETAAMTIRPDFSYVKPIASVAANGADPLDVDIVAMHGSELVRTKGEAVRTTIQTLNVDKPHAYAAWGTTALLGEDQNSRSRGTIANASFSTKDRTLSWQVDAQLMASRDPERITLRIRPASAGDLLDENRITAATRASITIPPGWQYQGVGSQDWVKDPDSSSDNPSFHPAVDIEGPSELAIDVIPPQSATKPFDLFHARLSHGLLGESTLVALYPNIAPAADLPRYVLPTTPYPIRLSPVDGAPSLATFGAAFANGGENTTVTQVDIEIPGGYDIWKRNGLGAGIFASFDDETGHENDAQGNWLFLDARHVRWVGVRNVSAGQADGWLHEFKVTSDATQATSIESESSEGVSTRLTFPNGFSSSTTEWSAAPGILHARVPSESALSTGDGYPSSGSSFTVNVTGQGVRQKANGTYATDLAASDALKLQYALANSSFSVRNRTIPLGGTLRADVDLQSLVSTAASLGATSTTLDVDLYAPPSMGCTPSAHWERTDTTLPHAGIRVLAYASALTPPLLIVGADDGNLYGVAQNGVPAWSLSLGAAPTQLIDAGVVGASHALFVGDVEGEVFRVDAALGTAEWTVCAAAGGCKTSDSLRNVTGLAYDANTHQVASVTRGGTVALVAADGTKVASRNDVGESYSAVGFDPHGQVITLSTIASGQTLIRGLLADNSALEQNASSVGSFSTLVADATGIWAGDHNSIVRLDPDHANFPELDRATFDSTYFDASVGIQMLAAAEVDGDGLTDVAAAFADGSLGIWDTNAGLHVFPATAVAYAPTPNEPFVPYLDQFLPQCPAPTYPDMGGQDPGSQFCGQVPRDSASRPLAIHLAHNSVVYAGIASGSAFLLHAPADLMAQPVLVGASHTIGAVTEGAWGFPPAKSVLAGFDDGIIEQRDPDTGEVVSSESVTSFVGRFTFQAPIPTLGFFGSHLLDVKVSWVNTQGETQSAHVIDWFDAVMPDGTPVTDPNYKMVLVTHRMEERFGADGVTTSD